MSRVATNDASGSTRHTRVRLIALPFVLVAAAGLGFLATPADSARSIVALELVGTADGAEALGFDKSDVLTSLAWDLGFIVAYVALLVLLVELLGPCFRLGRMREQFRKFAIAGAVGAGVLDLLEDACLAMGIRSDYATAWWWPAAATLAWAKWAVLLLVLVYLVGAVASVLTTPQYLRTLLRDPPPPVDGTPQVAADLGICLSGGGIRSASLSLGALQVLERPEGQPGESLGWGTADAVTAISGGSNIAGAIAISRSTRDDGTLGEPTAWAWLRDSDPVSEEEKRLMGNLGYLLARNPRGEDTTSGEGISVANGLTGDTAGPQPAPGYRPSAYATVFTGLFVNVTVIVLLIWSFSQPLGWLYRWLATLQVSCQGQDRADAFGCLTLTAPMVTPPVALIVAGVAGVLAWVFLGKRKLDYKAQLVAVQGIAFGLLALGVLLLWVLVVFPFLMESAGRLSTSKASLVSLLGSLGSLGSVVRILSTRAAKYAPVVGGIVFGLLLAFLSAYWSYLAATTAHVETWSGTGSLAWWGACMLVLGLTWWFTSSEWWALAGFYRGRLRGVYATYRKDGYAWPYANDAVSGSAEGGAEPGLADFKQHSSAGDGGTPLTVCTSCTVSTRNIKTHYGILAMSVTFTPEHVTMFVPQDDVGTWKQHRVSTEQLNVAATRPGASRITTMLAVAISSAAIAPAMGRFKIGPTSMLLAFANMRLGVWVPNPRYVEAAVAAEQKAFPKVRFGYLMKEFLGIHDPTDLYVYLTDGGHWENTGLVEILRKGLFKEVVCIDADPGPGDAVKSISEAIDLAVLETGARVSMNLDPLRAKLTDSRAPAYSTRSVTVGIIEHSDGSLGLLWYAKPGLSEDMPATLLAFRETHPDFPRVSTLNQFFDTSTYVAYRNLGRYNARILRQARGVLKKAMIDDSGGPRAWGDFSRVDDSTHWVQREVADLIENRWPDPTDRRSAFEQLRGSLAP